MRCARCNRSIRRTTFGTYRSRTAGEPTRCPITSGAIQYCAPEGVEPTEITIFPRITT